MKAGALAICERANKLSIEITKKNINVFVRINRVKRESEHPDHELVCDLINDYDNFHTIQFYSDSNILVISVNTA